MDYKPIPTKRTSEQRISTFAPQLDQALDGGLKRGRVTLLTGYENHASVLGWRISGIHYAQHPDRILAIVITERAAPRSNTPILTAPSFETARDLIREYVWENPGLDLVLVDSLESGPLAESADHSALGHAADGTGAALVWLARPPKSTTNYTKYTFGTLPRTTHGDAPCESLIVLHTPLIGYAWASADSEAKIFSTLSEHERGAA